ncbi:MAG: NAD(P)H-binding protein [Chloroflexota bacterium]
MILLTGGTGFIGRALVRQLVDSGYPVRTLVRPSPKTPNLPRGVPVEVAVVSLSDARGLRAAMRDVDTVIHLAGGEGRGSRANLLETDIRGTQNLSQAAADAGIRRILYLSHLGADRASAFPVLKAKGIAEEHLRRSGVPYTIFRTSIVFGPEDNFTTRLMRLIRLNPFFFLLPGDGSVQLQPLWVEDLVATLLLALQNPSTENKTYEIGGAEYFTFRQIVETLLTLSRKNRLLIPTGLPTLRALTVVIEASILSFPTSVFWVDYLSVNRTCPVDTLPRVFGLMPARFATRLNYLIPAPRRPLLEKLQQRLRSGK